LWMCTRYKHSNSAVVVESAAAVFAVGRARLRVTQSAHHIQIFPERFQRLQNFRKFEARAFTRWCPVIHRGTVRNVDACQPAPRIRGGFAERSLSRNHRFQEWQSHRYARTAEERAAGKMFLRDEHHVCLL